MPKKIPSFFFTSDANCNQLRALRARPNKLDNRSRKLKNFCDPFKTRPDRFKNNNRKDKLNSLKGLHELLAKSKNNPRLSPLLNSNKKSSSPNIKNIVSLNSLKKKHPNRMAVDFDHMYLDCGDSKISIGRDIEFQHLKQLNLLHVDFIQQQNDQLKAKDKIIKSLQEENKNLRARLDRLERRISLDHQKKPQCSSPISVQTDFPDCLAVKIEGSPKLPDHRSPSYLSPHSRRNSDKNHISILEEESLLSNESITSKRDSLRKSPKQIHPELSPFSSSPKLSPRERRSKSHIENSFKPPIDFDVPSSVSPSSNELSLKFRSPILKRIQSEETAFQRKLRHPDSPEKIKTSPESDEEEELTDHNLRSRHRSVSEQGKPESEAVSLKVTTDQSQKPVANSSQSSYPEIWSLRARNSLESQRGSVDGILTTSDPYFVHSDVVCELDDEEEVYQTQVEIPQWRIRTLNSLYVMEGTENLEDEIFEKRHSRPENDEKRRKRWDLQRMREQRQYEKLRERYECKNVESEGGDTALQNSLWPSPESIASIQLDNALPVCAFGQSLPFIADSDFELPWLSGQQTPNSSSSRRKKK